MQSLNVLIVGDGEYKNSIMNSKYLNKLYVAGGQESEGVINLKFNTFRELAKKCKALEVDIVLVEEEKWIFEGIADVMKKNFINCISVNSEWTKLGLSQSYTRTILAKYGINVPPKVTLPVDFPILIKGDGILKKANSMQEIISIKREIFDTAPELSKSVFLEKYLNGDKYKIISIFDGKHLLTFPNNNVNSALLSEYSKNLELLLQNEKANFMGFINSYLIEENNILYNTGFSFDFSMPDMTPISEDCRKDILFICMSAIYQKLDEIELR